MTARVHMRAEEGHEQRTLCGTFANVVVEQRGAVTCKSCKKLIAKLPPEEMTWREVVEYVLGSLKGPVVEPYPFAISHDEWVLMSCRMHGAPIERCGCVWCAWHRRHKERMENWYLSQNHRPHRKHEHPFGSLAAALSFFVRWRRDGSSLRSSTGSAGARLEAVARLGAEVQTTQRFDRDSLEVERAGVACDIEAAIGRALADEQMRRGLSVGDAYDALLTSLDESAGDAAHPAALAEFAAMTERAMRSMLAAARRALTVDLAARGIIPEPRERVGLAREIEMRRREIGRAA
jgi:hypothetical protein